MAKKIIIYGLTVFDEKGLVNYLQKGIFTNNRRFRYTQTKNADIIVVSYNGFAYGHMIVERMDKPNRLEKRDGYRKVYIIESTEVYKKRVKLKDFGINEIQFGKRITALKFTNIIEAGGVRKYQSLSGAGFGNSEQNQKIEKAAVLYITKKYLNKGWTVKSVESEKCGYDLRCLKNDKEEDVEVKGISGPSQCFIITAGEIKQAKLNSKFVLCAVNNVGTKEISSNTYTGRDFLAYFSFKGISFFAELEEKGK